MNLSTKSVSILVNPRTLIVCTRIGRTLGLCPNLFSSSTFIDHDLIRQGITSEDEQVYRKKKQTFFFVFFFHFNFHFKMKMI